MKRLVTLLMAASLTVALCACSNPLKTATDVVETTTDTTVVLEDPSVLPSFAIYDANDNTQVALTLGAIYADWHYLDESGSEQSVESGDASLTAAEDAAAAEAADTTTDTAAEAVDTTTDTAAEAADTTTDTTTEAADTTTDTTTEAADTTTDTAAEAADTTTDTAAEAADTTTDTTTEAADTTTDTTAEAADTTTDTTTEAAEETDMEAILAAAYLTLPTLDVDDDSEIYYIVDPGATPDCMIESSWKAEYIGDASADAMEIYTKLANFDSLPLKAQRVYQIEVTWDEENFEDVGYWGTLTYMFVTE